MRASETKEASDRVELRKRQLCAAALAYADEATSFDLMLAASRYAQAVAELRALQRNSEPRCLHN